MLIFNPLTSNISSITPNIEGLFWGYLRLGDWGSGFNLSSYERMTASVPKGLVFPDTKQSPDPGC